LRFQSKLIYTHVGAILVAVNPFEQLPIYGMGEMNRAYKGVADSSVYPHIYITAATSFMQLRTHKRHQSVLISGESGAGKTETTKKVLEYLALMSSGEGSSSSSGGVEKKILQSNPLLEALGNAKTRRNDNSSRFGKWMKVDFDAACRIQGCEIVNYLLEKSRVVGASTDERNYHVFYQLLKGADDELKSKLGLIPGRSDSPASFKYLVTSNDGGYTVPSIDDVSDFHDMQTAMATLQLAPETQIDLFRILAAILLLGNLSFGPGDGQLGAGTAPLVEQISSLLQVTQANLFQALTEKHMYIKGVLQPAQPYTAMQATDNRDALAKALYSNLFDSTIRHINSTLKLDASSSTECLHIGVLDIFGFEVFAKNSFEQLCINYCNEKLQSHFNEVIFTAEMQMYKDEGISTESISFKDIDNSDCVSLIEGKPIGLLCMLDSECVIGSASDVSYVANVDKAFGEVDVFKSSKLAGIKVCWSFLAKYGGKAGAGASCGNPQCALLHAKDITDVFPKSTSSDKETWKEMCKYATDVFAKNHQNAYYTKAKTSKVCFSVRHFAGAVEYTAGREPKSGEPSSSFSKEWLDKNSDELSALVVDCMLSSKSALICEGFGGGGGGRRAGEQQQGNKVSLGGQFRNQLIQLVENLNRTEPHFVRCVKSNNAKCGGVFDGHLVLEQLKYAGLFEAIRIRKAGYAYRASHDVFANQYLILVPGLLKEKFRNPTYFNVKDACIRIIKQVVEKDRVLFQGTAVVGHTKVFIKENSHRTDLDHFWRQKRNHFSVILSRFAKRYLDYHRTRSEREKLEADLRRTRETLEREKQEALERELYKSRQAVLLQKHARRFLVRCLFINMQDLIELRKALDPHGSKVYALKYPKRIERLKELIARIEKNSAVVVGGGGGNGGGGGASSSKSSALIRSMFSQEVAVARTMMKLIEIQETFRNDVKRAVEECDVVVLNKLLVRAERLEMANDEVVVEARTELRNLHRRRTVMKNMVAFLKNEYESSVDPAELLREARMPGVDEMFISKVKRVYDGAGPRLHTRTRLRTAIETIDRRSIESGVQEIEAIQQFRGRETFGEGEARAGRLMLRLLAFEAQAGGGSGVGADGYRHLFLGGDEMDDEDDEEGGGWGGPGALLTSEMISLCDEICSTSSLEAAKAAKRKLQHLASGTSSNSNSSKGAKASSTDAGLENVVRWYKWSKMLCTWKYPEVGGGSRANEEYEFFGLRASEARSSVFLIRTLHSDVNSDAPPSVQAALGALDLPANVKETMDKLERSFVKEEEEAAKEKEKEKKEKEKLGRLTHAKQRRLMASPSTKPVVQVKNIKPKPLHPFAELSTDLEAKLLESRKNLFRQVDQRDDSLTRLDRYKKKAAFRN
jgi:hypothetical protein